MKKMWEKVLLFVWLWCIIILSFIILTVRRIFMINFLNTAAQMVAAKSTISPDQKDLGAGTVASVVITGIVVVFIGLVLLILLVRLLLLVLILIAVLVLHGVDTILSYSARQAGRRPASGKVFPHIPAAYAEQSQKSGIALTQAGIVYPSAVGYHPAP